MVVITCLIFYDHGYDHQLGKCHHHQVVLWFCFYLMFWSTIKTIDFHHHHDHQGHDHLSMIIWSTALSSGCNHLGIASASSFCHHEHLKHVKCHHYSRHDHVYDQLIIWSTALIGCYHLGIAPASSLGLVCCYLQYHHQVRTMTMDWCIRNNISIASSFS